MYSVYSIVMLIIDPNPVDASSKAFDFLVLDLYVRKILLVIDLKL